MKGREIEGLTMVECLELLIDQHLVSVNKNGCWMLDVVYESGGKRNSSTMFRGRTISVGRLLAAVSLGKDIDDLDSENERWLNHKNCEKGCANPEHGKVESITGISRQTSQVVKLKAVSFDGTETLYFDVLRDVMKMGFNAGNVSLASRCVLSVNAAHGGTRSYKGYQWYRVND